MILAFVILTLTILVQFDQTIAGIGVRKSSDRRCPLGMVFVKQASKGCMRKGENSLKRVTIFTANFEYIFVT